VRPPDRLSHNPVRESFHLRAALFIPHTGAATRHHNSTFFTRQTRAFLGLGFRFTRQSPHGASLGRVPHRTHASFGVRFSASLHTRFLGLFSTQSWTWARGNSLNPSSVVTPQFLLELIFLSFSVPFHQFRVSNLSLTIHLLPFLPRPFPS